jgi:hypothetical protein
MTPPIFITSLARKRAEFQAELEHYERKAEKARDAIAKIDATLELFDAGQWTRYSKASFRQYPEWFKPKELPRLVIDILRASSEPLSTGDVQARLLEMKGIVLTTPAMRGHFSRRVTGALNDKRRYGLIVSDRRVAGRHLWRLARDGEAEVDPKRLEHWRETNRARSERRRTRR